MGALPPNPVRQIESSKRLLLALSVRWARDSGTIKPAAIHNGEGVTHYFHMTPNGRAAAMVLIITGNVGKFVIAGAVLIGLAGLVLAYGLIAGRRLSHR